jgi:hypothetical protein
MAMKIDRIELFHVAIPLAKPFHPAWIPGYPQTANRFTLARLTTDDGLQGLAAGVAFEREREGLGSLLGPYLIGLDPTDIASARQRIREASYLGWRFLVGSGLLGPRAGGRKPSGGCAASWAASRVNRQVAGRGGVRIHVVRPAARRRVLRLRAGFKTVKSAYLNWPRRRPDETVRAGRRLHRHRRRR